MATETTRDTLASLGRLLQALPRGYVRLLESGETGSSYDQNETKRYLDDLTERIHQLAVDAHRHFTHPGERLGKSVRCVVRVPTLTKSQIANQPGLSLLPAHIAPAVRRWQRVTPKPGSANVTQPRLFEPESPPHEAAEPPAAPEGEETVTADRRAIIVYPDSDYAVWLASKVSARTRRAYQSDMAHFLRSAALDSPDELATVGPAVLVIYRDAMTAAGAKPSTVARRLNTLRSFFNYLLALGRIERSPAQAQLVPAPRVPREGVTPGMAPAEVRKILRQPDTSTLKGLRDRAILSLGFYLGLRRQELADLTLSDLRQDRGHNVIEVFGKGGKSRVLTIPAIPFAHLTEYLQAAGGSDASAGSPLFPSMGQAAPVGAHLNGNDVWDVFKQYAAKAGLSSRLSPHSMRVCAITSALDHGAPIARVQLMAGHSDVRTTTRYFRAGEDLDESATYAVKY